MKITIVMGAFYPFAPAPGGAAERIWHGLGRELIKRGHEVHVISRAWPGLPRRAAVDGMRVLRTTNFSATGKLPIDLLFDLIYALRVSGQVEKSDVIISNDFWYPVVSRLRQRGPLLINIGRVPKGQVRLYTHAKAVLVPSDAMVGHLLNQGVDEAKAIKLHNPIDLDAFASPLIPRRFAGGPYRVMYAGRIHPEKGIEHFIEALRILEARGERHVARIIGPYRVDQGGIGPEYRAKLQAMAQNLPIEFLDPLFERPLLAEQFRWADFFVYPSLAEQGESFGVAPLEAMSTGAVPVVSALTCFSEFMRGGVGAIFDHRGPRPAEALAHELSSLFQRADLAKQSERSQEIASQFGYSHVARRLEEIIAAVC